MQDVQHNYRRVLFWSFAAWSMVLFFSCGNPKKNEYTKNERKILNTLLKGKTSEEEVKGSFAFNNDTNTVAIGQLELFYGRDNKAAINTELGYLKDEWREKYRRDDDRPEMIGFYTWKQKQDSLVEAWHGTNAIILADRIAFNYALFLHAHYIDFPEDLSGLPTQKKFYTKLRSRDGKAADNADPSMLDNLGSALRWSGTIFLIVILALLAIRFRGHFSNKATRFIAHTLSRWFNIRLYKGTKPEKRYYGPPEPSWNVAETRETRANNSSFEQDQKYTDMANLNEHFARVTELEHQVRKLQRELDELKSMYHQLAASGTTGTTAQQTESSSLVARIEKMVRDSFNNNIELISHKVADLVFPRIKDKMAAGLQTQFPISEPVRPPAVNPEPPVSTPSPTPSTPNALSPVYASVPQGKTFTRLSPTKVPQESFFIIMPDAREPERGEFDLNRDPETLIHFFAQRDQMLDACELLGMNQPDQRNYQVQVTRGRVVKSGDHWEITNKLKLDW